MSEDKAVLAAKMYLFQVSKSLAPDGSQYNEELKLSPVYGTPDSPANRAWSQATPSGGLQLTITNKEAFGVVPAGYYKVLLVPCGEHD
jgi:hypothetical protein